MRAGRFGSRGRGWSGLQIVRQPIQEWVSFVGIWRPPLALYERLAALIGDGADLAALQARRRARYEDLLRERIVPMSGFTGLMELLTAHGYRRGLASTSSRTWVDLVLDELAVRHHFHVIVAGDGMRARKPTPDVYLRAAERLAAPPADCLALEDSAPGVAAAKADGMVCTAVPNRAPVFHDLCAADRQVAELGEGTLDLLRAL
jgi:HAD superfamily hydrolase (TIGR01509 family)